MADKETIIGPETRVSGELRGDEDVVVRGRVEGRVLLNATFTVEESAIIQADVEARIILISGVVVGNLTAVESIRLAQRARVVGDIIAPRVIMEEGATYKGRLDMGQSVEARDAQARTAARRSEDEETGRASPPRLSVPPRVTEAPARVSESRINEAPPRVTESPPARVAAAPPMPPRPVEGPPSLPAPEEAAAGGVASAPAWAKKKLHRRT
jgi:cytoskeletal protein CcmA (bactofilin family)